MSSKTTEFEIKITDIMKGQKNVVLLHDEKRYSLSITRRGKLILTAAEEALNSKVTIIKSTNT